MNVLGVFTNTFQKKPKKINKMFCQIYETPKKKKNTTKKKKKKRRKNWPKKKIFNSLQNYFYKTIKI